MEEASLPIGTRCTSSRTSRSSPTPAVRREGARHAIRFPDPRSRPCDQVATSSQAGGRTMGSRSKAVGVGRMTQRLLCGSVPKKVTHRCGFPFRKYDGHRLSDVGVGHILTCAVTTYHPDQPSWTDGTSRSLVSDGLPTAQRLLRPRLLAPPQRDPPSTQRTNRELPQLPPVRRPVRTRTGSHDRPAKAHLVPTTYPSPLA